MSITNTQYNSIMHKYDAAQLRNRRIQADRQEEVYTRIPEYAAIERQISSLCVGKCRKMLEGDDLALEEMKKELHALSDRKATLLKEYSFPADYLEPLYDCADCHDTGYLPDGSRCHCLKQNIITLLYEQSNLKDILEKENFAHLTTDYYSGEDFVNYQQILDKIHKFISDFKTTYQNLFFYGTVGTGKSFLSNCIAKELIDQGHSVIYFSASQLFETLSQYTFDRQNRETSSAFLSDLYDCDLLIIDDLGAECTNRLTSTELFGCINERALRQKPVLISSNLQLAELSERYSERIFSRITSNYQLLKFTGPDIRILQKIAHRK
ncbi:MAG: AAA family ATPase [Lachnospiraceae bacterium]|nr:AAA family ATPase [Lachnospiraceae bacterium]